MNLIRSIVSVFLAFLMLAATIGVTVNMHYCGGRIRSVAFYAKADACQNESACHTERTRGCCAEKSFVLKAGENTLNPQTFFQTHPVFVGLYAILPVLYDIGTVTSTSSIRADYSFYRPPILHRTSSVFLQIFLI